MEIRQNGQIDPGAWDNFVEMTYGASPYQLWGWKDIYESIYGLQVNHIAAYSQGDIIGAMPLIFVNSPLTGRYITTPPGGIAFENKEAGQLLVDYGREVASKLGVQYLAIRDSEKQVASPQLQTTDNHCAFVIDLCDCDGQYPDCITRKTRQKVNRAKREGITSKLGNRLIDDFYPVYLQAMRERGTPTQGITFFRKAFEKFPDRMLLIVLYLKDEVVGGGFVFDFAETMYCTWSGLPQKYYDLYSAYMLFWVSLRYAFLLDKKEINFGRSMIESGPYFFKRQWTKDTKQLYQQYYLNTIESPPAAGNHRAESVYFKAFTSLWQRLPLSVTEAVGPKLRKRVPFG